MVVLWFAASVALVAINVLLQGADVWTTVLALESGAVEENVVSRTIMDKFGIGTWITIKALLTAGIVSLLLWLRKADENGLKQSVLAGAFLVAWMGFVVGGNLQVLGII
jgi:hypothetical protein